MKKILVSDYDQTFYLNDIDMEKNKNTVDELKQVAIKEFVSVSDLIDEII